MTSLVANTAEEKRTPTLSDFAIRLRARAKIAIRSDSEYDKFVIVQNSDDANALVQICNSFDALTERVAELEQARDARLREMYKAEAERDALTEANKKLVALVQRYASECSDCGGKGYVYEGEAITGRGPDDVFPEQVACPECEDIRAAIKVTP